MLGNGIGFVVAISARCHLSLLCWTKRAHVKPIPGWYCKNSRLTCATRQLHQSSIVGDIPQEGIGSIPTLLFPYTAGQWLHLDKQQRDARYVRFDFDRLYQEVLPPCPPGTPPECCRKIEGGFSKVFILETDNGRNIVVKFSTSIAGSARHVVNSKVATITYYKRELTEILIRSHVQRNTKVSIPNILDWSDDPTNVIDSLYIIMEHASGVLLQDAWVDMPPDKKIKCIGSICTSILPITTLDLPAYGSLYFADAPFLDTSSKQTLDIKHCIGPHCNGIPYQGSIEKYLELFIGQRVFSDLIQHPETQAAAPTLFQPDLHKRNVFVSKDDPAIVTGIIDWQGASIKPESLCYQAYEVGLAMLSPRLGATKKIDETLLRPFRYSDEATGFMREALIQQGLPNSSHEPWRSYIGGGGGWLSVCGALGGSEASSSAYLRDSHGWYGSDKDRDDLKTMWPFDQCQLEAQEWKWRETDGKCNLYEK
ncbi:conserved hypothetical protein [Microsporum canis CBS 113480]|uniref:Altered inheritance of mitochondria protein 9, mitochondrial n=1 Tax=Arthroderma otae (strain ATCC MYA-4605 / CBS 113480) TaxID=554155 RepID=C5FYA0_ARTOC|nr:conserved hypothetical protein [Microsporum canis CBS 113480]EEQ34498.1 conserved hypothetical protein [Microsporum canis CBS 113480]